MATGNGQQGPLNGSQIASLAAAMTRPHMEIFAQGHLRIKPARLSHLADGTHGNSVNFNINVLNHWSGKSTENNVQCLANLLYKAIDNDQVVIDQASIQQILGVPRATASVGVPSASQGTAAATQDSTAGTPLSEKMMSRLSKKFSMKFDLTTLAVDGLELESDEVELSIQNNRDDCRQAAFDVIKKWARSQDTMTSAYVKMCHALRQVDMKNHIETCLYQDK